MGLPAFAAVGIGAALGAWLRWGLGTLMNPLLPELPMGTLAANLLGGYLVGLAVALFSQHPGLAPEARLFLITGFLGGLTTFSTFSAEAVHLITRGQIAWAFGHMGLHLAGSLAMTMLGVWTYKALTQG
ncbi:MAG: fluoride efflux transporter CrcB [Holophagaceae bacterium]